MVSNLGADQKDRGLVTMVNLQFSYNIYRVGIPVLILRYLKICKLEPIPFVIFGSVADERALFLKMYLNNGPILHHI